MLSSVFENHVCASCTLRDRVGTINIWILTSTIDRWKPNADKRLLEVLLLSNMTTQLRNQNTPHQPSQTVALGVPTDGDVTTLSGVRATPLPLSRSRSSTSLIARATISETILSCAWVSPSSSTSSPRKFTRGIMFIFVCIFIKAVTGCPCAIGIMWKFGSFQFIMLAPYPLPFVSGIGA